jgi:hypothetical protein
VQGVDTALAELPKLDNVLDNSLEVRFIIIAPAHTRSYETDHAHVMQNLRKMAHDIALLSTAAVASSQSAFGAGNKR